mmetsp:Transcript_25823/g.58209  ORF Transcript_25823/g.58209 Transcript_25823/m.58209 type:complete len:81 (-) Transcript_25823:862-1104(-)
MTDNQNYTFQLERDILEWLSHRPQLSSKLPSSSKTVSSISSSSPCHEGGMIVPSPWMPPSRARVALVPSPASHTPQLLGQ